MGKNKNIFYAQYTVLPMQYTFRILSEPEMAKMSWQ